MKTNDVIVLDDLKEYVVVSKVNHNGSDYIFIIEVNNTSNYKIAEVEDGEISVIEADEQELLDEIIPLFGLDAQKTIEKITSEN